ncbi:MAG: VWA domain-containing protein [Phycisphaerales bacterium]|nr:VWA domain-containing protein [Phycisphaerales bacterium]
MKNSPRSHRDDPANGTASAPPRDELDGLLRVWHARNADAAAAGRDRLLATLASERATPRRRAATVETTRFSFWRTVRSPRLKLAASFILILVLVTMFLPTPNSTASASTAIMVPDGGRLDARDRDGNLLGPCPLKHTDVDAHITGRFSRVSVRQRYTNTYDTFIEAVYTFPLGHRSAVDRMTMTVGDRVIVGDVKEREEARRIYQQAIESGYVASLLEQERPNIFTQSIGNIPPGETIVIEISYVEMLQSVDGVYAFDFPMVVSPRYIPGRSGATMATLPEGLEAAPGIVLLGPATFGMTETGATEARGILGAPQLARLMSGAIAIRKPGVDWWGTTPVPPVAMDVQIQGAQTRKNMTQLRIGAGFAHGLRPGMDINLRHDRHSRTTMRIGEVGAQQALGAITSTTDDDSIRALAAGDVIGIEFTPEPRPNDPTLWYQFEARYANGSSEIGRLYTDGTGWLNNRWFFVDVSHLARPGAGFAADTDQVPDASRITPMPVPPGTRAGHDIGITVTIDTGGPGIRALDSELHEIDRADAAPREADGLPQRVTLALKTDRDIPNRDFILKWRQTDDTIEEAVFAHAGDQGRYFTMLVDPPARVAAPDIRPREMVFVLDCSGSMKGFPIAKAKETLVKALKTMRADDTFNIITFNNSLSTLWDEPRAFTEERLAEAMAYVEARQGGGGTEMKPAVLKSLEPAANRAIDLAALADLPADGRGITVRLPVDALVIDGRDGPDGRSIFGRLRVRDGLDLRWTNADAIDLSTLGEATELVIRGLWGTSNGERTLAVSEALGGHVGADPLRIVFFLTDGEVGNDMEILDAITRHRRMTRFFSVGIGDSPNRYLLDGMAKAGCGAADFITDEGNADELVERFVRRITTPVLTNIEVTINGGAAQIVECFPPLDAIPDLYDETPLVIHGRYEGAAPNATLTLRGRTGRGAYEKTMAFALPAESAEHDVLPTLWARAKVDAITTPHLKAMQDGNVPPDVKAAVVALGVEYRLMTPFTSFVAVEKAKVNLDGRPMLVAVPVEYPHGMTWEGVFGANREQLGADAAWFEQDRRDAGRDATDGGARWGADVDALGARLGRPVLKSDSKSISGGEAVDFEARTAGEKVVDAIELGTKFGTEARRQGGGSSAGSLAGLYYAGEGAAHDLRTSIEYVYAEFDKVATDPAANVPSTEMFFGVDGVAHQDLTFQPNAETFRFGNTVDARGIMVLQDPQVTPLLLGDIPALGLLVQDAAKVPAAPSPRPDATAAPASSAGGGGGGGGFMKEHRGRVVLREDQLAAGSGGSPANQPAGGTPRPNATPSAPPPPAPATAAPAEAAPARDRAIGDPEELKRLESVREQLRKKGATTETVTTVGGTTAADDRQAGPTRGLARAIDETAATTDDTVAETAETVAAGDTKADADTGVVDAAGLIVATSAEPEPVDEAVVRRQQATALARASVALIVALDFNGAAVRAQQALSIEPEQPVATAMMTLLTDLAREWQARGEHGFIASGGHLVTPRLVGVAVDEAKAGRVDVAREIAFVLGTLHPSAAPVMMLVDALVTTADDGAATPDVPRTAALDAVAKAATDEIESYVRQIKLDTRLDPAARPLISGDATGELRVTVLVDRPSVALAASLRTAGLVIEQEAPDLRLYVGRAKRSAMESIALQDGVRRIEPTRAAPLPR